MPFLDDRVTAGLRLFVAALGRPRDSAEVRAALDQLGRWTEHELLREDDAGGDGLVSYRDGVRLAFSSDELCIVTFEVQANPHYTAFAHPEELLAGLDTGLDQPQMRAVLGEPLNSEYRNDRYLINEGVELFLSYRPNRSLQRVIVKGIPSDERPKLIRKARERASKAPTAKRTQIEVFDEDGILAIIDPSAYRARLDGWNFDSLSRHFADEMNARHAAVWMTGSDGYGEWTIEFRATPSEKSAFRESSHVVEVSAGHLAVVNYTSLTQAADDGAAALTADSADWSFALENGRYRLDIRQMFDPDELTSGDGDAFFEIVYSRADMPAPPVAAPLWWAHG